jgi:hypothetical protein
MPRYRHPRVGPDDDARFAVDLGGTRVVLDSDGCFESDNRAYVEELAGAYDTTVEAMRVDEVDDTTDTDDSDEYECGATLDGGGTCSRAVATPDATCYQH